MSVTPVPAEAKVTPLMVTEFPLALIVPVVVPPIEPALPFVESVIPVLVNTFVALFPASCDWIVTLNVPPAVGEDGVTAVITNFEAGAGTMKFEEFTLPVPVEGVNVMFAVVKAELPRLVAVRLVKVATPLALVVAVVVPPHVQLEV